MMLDVSPIFKHRKTIQNPPEFTNSAGISSANLAMASFFSATPAFRVVICKSWGAGRAGNTHHGDGYQNGPWWLGKFTHTDGTGRTTWACPHASSMIIALSFLNIPYTPCMVYLPTFGWFLGQMLVNMPYMDPMGMDTLFWSLRIRRQARLGVQGFGLVRVATELLVAVVLETTSSMGISGSWNGGTVPYKAIFCGDIPWHRPEQ